MRARTDRIPRKNVWLLLEMRAPFVCPAGHLDSLVAYEVLLSDSQTEASPVHFLTDSRPR